MKEQFLEFLENSLQLIMSHKQISIECETNGDIIKLHGDLINYCNQLNDIVQNTELAINYLTHFQNDINTIQSYLPYYHNANAHFVNISNKEQIRKQIEAQKDNLTKQLVLLQFNLNFFQKINFFSKNIVAVGANGSGKTTLANKLKEYLPTSGVVIAAQKILIIPTFSGISNINQTYQKLQQIQSQDKSYRVSYSTENNGNSWSIVNNICGEFQVILDNLLSNNYSTIVKYNQTLKNGDMVQNKPITTLDKVLEIWNSLIQHRILECNDGINLTLKPDIGNSYEAYKMSDGEKVALYLIAQVLQAPQNGFIITDEPEMFLHKTILRKLWDRLEQERQDCIFVYLTHDLDFATSRNAKKVWIKSYTTPPDNWEIENIPENELPESLLLELLGSRKPILFCESQKEKNDETIYNCLFPEYTIKPVEGCFNVINYTKLFNRIENATTKATGITDADYHNTDRINALKSENIFALPFAEIENLLLDETFLKLAAEKFNVVANDAVENIKQKIIKKFETDLELQVSNYLSAKIDYYFKNSNVEKGNTIDDVHTKFDEFTKKINITDWYNSRKAELEKIIAISDYSKIISVYNNKGLKCIVNDEFKIKDFTERAIKFLQSSKEAQDIIKKNFPKEIIAKNATN